MAIWAAVIGGGISLLGGMFGSNNGPQQGSNSPAYYDPYAPYRANAAQQLQELMQNPGNVAQNPVYGAMLTAAQRQAASQGYNGSGNALVAAANAGGQAYQQQFNDLAMLSGANQSPANGAMLATNQGNTNNYMQSQIWSNLGNMAGRGVYNYNNPPGGGGGTSWWNNIFGGGGSNNENTTMGDWT